MFCRNRYITRNTSTTASISVSTTWLIDRLMKVEVSYGMVAFTPAGKYGRSSSSRFFTRAAVCSALAVGVSWMPMPVEGSPLSRVRTP